MRRSRSGTALVSIVGLIAGAAGCVAMIPGMATVSSLSVSPSVMAYTGGQVIVTATVEGTGVVIGAAGYPNDHSDLISLSEVAPGSGHYRGTVAIRPNVTGEAMEVTIVVGVADPDTDELLDYDAATVTVDPAPSLPPDPPSI